MCRKKKTKEDKNMKETTDVSLVAVREKESYTLLNKNSFNSICKKKTVIKA